MEECQYYIFEITEGGMVKKALKHGFKSKDEAEKRIKVIIPQLDRRRFIAIKLQ